MPYYIVVTTNYSKPRRNRPPTRAKAIAAKEPVPGSIVVTHCSQNRRKALDVLKLHPGSRMIVLETIEDFTRFLKKPWDTRYDTKSAIGASSFPALEVAPTLYSNVADFRMALETGNKERIWQLLASVRQVLINYKGEPRLFQASQENALHIAARAGHMSVCNLLLDTIRNPKYVAWAQNTQFSSAVDTAEALLRKFLNERSRTLCETPLHTAARYGHSKVVATLIAFPQCQYLPNKYGLFPVQVNTTRTASDVDKNREWHIISDLLEKNYFVPLIRTEDDLDMPFVGEPFSRDNAPKFTRPGGRGPAAQYVKAFAGPMTLSEAIDFRSQWQSSPTLTTVAANDHQFFASFDPNTAGGNTGQEGSASFLEHSFRHTRQENAMERVGRNLARFANVGWQEYWEFLGVMCDLRSYSGRLLLESYIETRAKNMRASGNQPTYAIGKFSDPENLIALMAFGAREVDENRYPYIWLWQKHMRNISGMRELINETILLDDM
ncbi:ankyrin repeat and LEM domain-containing protein 2-like isoform X2 [Anopheles stephensi]|uniref:ankyrin repeat and LEM domain-containing protein 2-like isoform X2 n=1 Tax=Anopheles stephensi TaxID=30069 RepID=UPI00165879F2|nr:ankyrin repeat and LEM domain-containing protein 2-like isoform X2 [Anopheles stephensi]